MFGYWEKEPVGALRRHLSALWVWKGTAPPIRHRVLPDGCIDIVFGAGGTAEGDSQMLSVVGTMTRHIEVSRAELPLVLGARFRPAGAVPFLECSASEITDASVPLEDVWGKDANRLHERLAECVSISERLDILQGALLVRLAGARQEDTRMMYAARCIANDTTFSNLSDLAVDLGMSLRQFRRRFQAEVGIGPKRFSRIIRFQRLLETVLERGGLWADLALEHGYFDQAHLIRDFKEFTGLGPTQYMATRSDGRFVQDTVTSSR
jgi:AraC-like DNA-binding protein